MNYCLWCHDEIINHIHWTNLVNITKTSLLCTNCSQRLESISTYCCSKCSRPLEVESICYDCERWEDFYKNTDPLIKNYSLYMYNDFMQEVIAKWKYRGDYHIREMFRNVINESIYKLIQQENIDPILVPIPLSSLRTLERGFNQASALAELIDKKVKRSILTRVHSEKQSKLGRDARMHTTNPFKITKAINKSVIIIDDIYTTGRTIRHAAALLKAAGAPKVFSFTLVRG